MERLINPAGGRPIKNEDLLEYIQAFDVLEEWFNALGIGDCIVYGCVATAGDPGFIDYSSGVIYYNGKLRIFDGVTDVPDGAPEVDLEAQDIDINPRTFDDGNTKDTATIFKMVVGGSDFLLGPDGLPNTKTELLGLTPTKTKIVDIGAWNMDGGGGETSLDVAHGLSDHTKIISAKANIIPDTDSAFNGLIYDFEAPAGAISGPGNGLTGKHWDATDIYLYSHTGSFFDSADFDAVGYSRGKILITYID